MLGLELGADDYVTKPFSAAELAARAPGGPAPSGPAGPGRRERSKPATCMDLDTHE